MPDYKNKRERPKSLPESNSGLAELSTDLAKFTILHIIQYPV